MAVLLGVVLGAVFVCNRTRASPAAQPAAAPAKGAAAAVISSPVIPLEFQPNETGATEMTTPRDPRLQLTSPRPPPPARRQPGSPYAFRPEQASTILPGDASRA